MTCGNGKYLYGHHFKVGRATGDSSLVKYISVTDAVDRYGSGSRILGGFADIGVRTAGESVYVGNEDVGWAKSE